MRVPNRESSKFFKDGRTVLWCLHTPCSTGAGDMESVRVGKVDARRSLASVNYAVNSHAVAQKTKPEKLIHRKVDGLLRMEQAAFEKFISGC
jgi:hypothetical protein